MHTKLTAISLTQVCDTRLIPCLICERRPAAAYRKATEIEPDSAKYFNNLGTALSATGAAAAAAAASFVKYFSCCISQVTFPGLSAR
jgi:hypothetical protein